MGTRTESNKANVRSADRYPFPAWYAVGLGALLVVLAAVGIAAIARWLYRVRTWNREW